MPSTPKISTPVLTARSTSVSIARVHSNSATSMRMATSLEATLPESWPITRTVPSGERTR